MYKYNNYDIHRGSNILTKKQQHRWQKIVEQDLITIKM